MEPAVFSDRSARNERIWPFDPKARLGKRKGFGGWNFSGIDTIDKPVSLVEEDDGSDEDRCWSIGVFSYSNFIQRDN